LWICTHSIFTVLWQQDRFPGTTRAGIFLALKAMLDSRRDFAADEFRDTIRLSGTNAMGSVYRQRRLPVRHQWITFA
jgi:hypothetical protein